MRDRFEFLLVPASALERFHRAQADGSWATMTTEERAEVLDAAIPEASRIKTAWPELFACE